MTAGSASPERLVEVVRLSTLLADQILDAQITKRSIPAEQVAALIKAANFLQERGVEWPPLMMQVIHTLTGGGKQL